jgi:hypothetical protein
MFSIDSVDFLKDSLSFGFNTAKEISPFCMFFYFQGPSRRQTDQSFTRHFFWEIEDREKKLTGNTTRRKIGAPRGPMIRLQRIYNF